MFIQVIRGTTRDPDAVRDTVERWHRALQPEGYLGTTAGVADDGTFIACVRFTSEAAARASSDRPEQDAWWTRTTELFEGAPTVYDCPTAETYFGDVPDEAGFVQVEVFHGVSDTDEFRSVAQGWDGLSHLRPDLLNVCCGYAADGTVIATNHFTSEAEAREFESQEPPPEAIALMERWNKIVDRTEYIDLREPVILTAATARERAG